MTKTARKSHEIARLFAEGAEARGTVREFIGWTEIKLSDKQGEWLSNVAEREGGWHTSSLGDSRMRTKSWAGRPADPQPGDGDIEFSLDHMWGRWRMAYRNADPIRMAEDKARDEAYQKAWRVAGGSDVPDDE